jgi:hypothetical protein
MTRFETFGSPDRFEIAVRWRTDAEPRARRPRRHGWSIGDLRISVCGRVLTQNSRGAAKQTYVSWYLAPMFQWLADNWGALLHESDFAWTEKAAAPAAMACGRALLSWIVAEDARGQETYRDVQAWWTRHALRSCAEGGLFPDLFIRRC